MFVTDAARIGETEALKKTVAAVRGGAGVIQLRDKAASAAELLARSETLRRALPDAILLVNDRVDVALAAGVDGVQLGAGALPVTAARRLLGPAALIGRSVHSVPEAVAAEVDGADFLVVGTIYPTDSHPGKAPVGPALLEAVTAAVRLPFYAIGGITVATAADCIRRGAHGIAVIRAISAAADPEAAARALVTAAASRSEGGR